MIDYDVISQSSVDAYMQAPDSEKAQLYDLLEKSGYSPIALEKLGPKPDPGAPPNNPHIDPPSSLDGYRIKPSPAEVEGLDVGEVAARDASIKSAFFDAGVPQDMANSLADVLHRASANIVALEREGGDAARIFWEREKETLLKVYGEEKAKSLMLDAGVAANRMGGLGKIFPSGAVSAEAIVSLAGIAAVLRHRGLIK
ncbi:MAG: hypothetical protein L0Z50_40570 [Verrucomicrobiales bacterium]|nr:hypothetical protein [Verrucomicrobiales bacterium]